MALTKVSGDFIQDGSITQGHLHASHGITTSDIGEGSNLYFTTARVDSRIGDLSTSDLSEGTNLYYTDARADARIALQVGSNLDLSSKSTSDLSEGTNLYYTDARADARITAADTDSLSEGSTNLYYTDARADARVALIVDSAPGTLNTLNELAAALGDDANFSTTVTNSIATKLPLAGGTITSGTNIGLTINHDSFEKGLVIHRNHATNAGSIVFKNNTGIIGTLLAISSDNQPYWQEGAGTDSYKIWHENNDGSGSGLDADKLDGQQGTYYLDYGNFTSTPTIPTDFVSKANGGQFEGVITIKEDTNSTGTAGKSFLTLHNVNSDISQQQSFIDFKFTDTNANYTPQVRIGAQVGPDADANAISKEGAGSFVVYTSPIGSDELGGSTGLAEQFRVSYNGTVTAQGQIIATGGNSTQWNTAYTYSQVGHLPLTGGTITSDLTVNSDFQAANTRLKLINYSGGTGITSQGELMIRSDGKTGWTYGDELGKISFYQTDGSGNGPGYQASIRATNETGNGSTTTISSCGLHFYTSNYNALERYAGRIDHDMIWDSKGGFAVDGTRKDVNWDAAYTYSQVGHMALSGDQSISGTKTFSNGSLVISGSHATISFLDTSSSADDFYIHVNSNNFYVLTDRDGGNEVDAGYESPHPLQLEADTNTAYTFGNRILTTADEGSGNGIDADTLDGVQGALFLRSDSDDTFTGRLVVANTGVRRAGMYGIYDSTKTGHIWSMGGAYMIPQNGADFGNLYGLAYYHPNNNTNGQMASGHQMVWCANGNPQSAIGTNIWTDGLIIADGASFGGDVSMNGRTINMGNGSISGINHLAINDPGYGEGISWSGGNGWQIYESSDANANSAGNLQFATGSTHRFRINTSGSTYSERHYDISNTTYYVDPAGVSNTVTTYAVTQMRAPIYYSITNTAYYTRPHTSSYINSLHTAGNIQAGSSGTGNIYIGGTSGNYFRFHTNNSHTYFDANVGNINWRQGTSTRFTFYMTTANMTINGTLTQNSDERIKENIVEIPNALEKIDAMRGVYYNRTDFNTDVTKVGVIAQEVEAVLPEAILEAPDTGLKSVAYGELTAVLINAIKEQQTIIDDLKSRLETLENQ